MPFPADWAKTDYPATGSVALGGAAGEGALNLLGGSIRTWYGNVNANGKNLSAVASMTMTGALSGLTGLTFASGVRDIVGGTSASVVRVLGGNDSTSTAIQLWGHTSGNPDAIFIDANGAAASIHLRTGAGGGVADRISINQAGYITISGLVNAANDGAAASAGVPVGAMYRNGSVLMVRVA